MGVALSRLALHRMPTRSAPCPDTLRIMRRGRPHRVPTCSASCTDTLRTVCRCTAHHLGIEWLVYWGRHLICNNSQPFGAKKLRFVCLFRRKCVNLQPK